VSCWSIVITRTVVEVLLGLSIFLSPTSCERYIANLDCFELPACVLQGDTRENVHYVAKTSYCIIEKDSTYAQEKDDSNAL
jgi:hypothetical protein